MIVKLECRRVGTQTYVQAASFCSCHTAMSIYWLNVKEVFIVSILFG